MDPTTPISAPERLRPAPTLPRPVDPKLWKAAKQFEEIFLAQFVSAMRSSGGSGLLQRSPGHDTFNRMFSEAIAREMAESGGLGLHRMIYRRLGGTFTSLSGGAPMRPAPDPQTPHSRPETRNAP